MVTFLPLGYLVPSVPYLKLHVNEPLREYTSGDEITGRIDLRFPDNDFISQLKKTHKACSVVLQLKCTLKLNLGDKDLSETIVHERRTKVLDSNYSMNIMAAGRRVEAFKLRLNERLSRQPPTLTLREGAYAGSGIEWSLAAWIEGKNNKGYIEVNHRIRDEQIIKFYPRFGQRIQEQSDRELTNQKGCSSCQLELTALPAYLPQSPEQFNLKLAVSPSRGVFIYGVDFELEMELTFFGSRTVVHKNVEKIASIVYNDWVLGETALVAGSCVIPTRRSQNISTPKVKLEHNLLVTFRGQETVQFRTPVDVVLPYPFVADIVSEDKGLCSKVLGWLEPMLFASLSPSYLY